MIEDLGTFANNDPIVQMRGCHIDMDISIGIGDRDFIVTLEKGLVVSVEQRRFSLESGVFAIRAANNVWEKNWQSVPKRDYHDLFSMFSSRLATIEGDLKPLMQNLLYFKALLASPRGRDEQQDKQSTLPSPGFEPIVGRYLNMQFQSKIYRIYFEEAGKGIPLICLHTAGSDSRQYRHLVTDPSITTYY